MYKQNTINLMGTEEKLRTILEKWEEYYWVVLENNTSIRLGSQQMFHIDFSIKYNASIILSYNDNKLIGDACWGFVNSSTEYFIIQSLINLICKEYFETERSKLIKNNTLLMMKTDRYVKEIFIESFYNKSRFS